MTRFWHLNGTIAFQGRREAAFSRFRRPWKALVQLPKLCPSRSLGVCWKRRRITGTERLLLFLIALIVVEPVAGDEPNSPAGPNRWESAIAAMERADQASPPPKRGILFVGSSSIRLWKLRKSFPNRPVINRGFGGSHIADSLHFADRIILPHQPRIVTVYAGDNDIAAGKSPKQVRDDLRALVETIHAKLPNTRIVFISIKPSSARWKFVDSMRHANSLIRNYTEEDDRCVYVDADTPMLGDDGKPRRELFANDGLHLSAAGYKLWTQLVKPHLASNPPEKQ